MILLRAGKLGRLNDTEKEIIEEENAINQSFDSSARLKVDDH